MNYEDMTNAQLKELCKDNDIEVNAKKATQPTRAELMTAIENAGLDEDVAIDSEIATDAEVEAEGIVQEEDALSSFEKAAMAEAESLMTPEAKLAKAEKKVRATKAQKQKKELMRLVRVIIVDHQKNQTAPVKNAVHFVGWGNRLVGYHTERIVLGKPWHVRQGALDNLRSVIMTVPIQNDEKNRIDWESGPRYSITELPPLTRDELEDIAKKQRIREQSTND
jgi:hypothetical protein